MPFTVQLYQIFDDPRKIVKTLGEYNTAECRITNAVSVISPTLELMGYTPAPYINYAYIPEFKRYYFINRTRINTAGRMEIDLTVDVLMTYSAELLNTNMLIIRNQNVGSTYVDDKTLPLYPYKQNKIIEFSENEFNLNTADLTTFNFLLNVAGGGGSQDENKP